ncbi:hypothetical protein AB0K00_44390 [Dactylosporangium sp. NPDC049525]|uniref:hypothetical protein n=1 Tax=Dactylosporangium sp. NPDC049525 TaxID=3154730 RepID=UPI00342334D4
MTTADAAVVVLDERDYRYGAGPLRLRVEAVDRSGAIAFDGEPWLPVRGVRLRRDGTEVGPVQVLVRAAQLPPG